MSREKRSHPSQLGRGRFYSSPSFYTLDWSSLFFDEIKWTPGRNITLATQGTRRGAKAGATFEMYSKKTVSREGLRSGTIIAATAHKTHRKIAQAKITKMCCYCFISIQDRGEIIPAENIHASEICPYR